MLCLWLLSLFVWFMFTIVVLLMVQCFPLSGGLSLGDDALQDEDDDEMVNLLISLPSKSENVLNS